MERKRGVEGEGSSQLPPAKVMRTAPADSAAPGPGGAAAAAAPTPESAPEAPDDVQLLQRAQLAALVEDHRRDIKWMHGKLEELQQLVAVLDAAPRAALYHMDAVREDLTLTLSTLGLGEERAAELSPLAARMLDHEVVTNESLGEVPAALKSLSARIVSALENGYKADDPDVQAARDANAELQARFREVSDQLERYAERDKQSLVSSTTLRDELDDCRSENAMRRNRIACLEQALLRSKEQQPVVENGVRCKNCSSVSRHDAAAGGAQDANAGERSQSSGKVPGSQSGSDTEHKDWKQEAADAQEQSKKRLEELEQMQEQLKTHIAKIQRLDAEIAKRDSGVVPIPAVIKSALYQTMEATLQQLFLKEQKWAKERDSLAEEREQEQKSAESRLASEKQAIEQLTDDYKKQIEELRRCADAAKAEKDKVVMTYEARKMESGSVATIKGAAEKRLNLCEDMRKKLSASNAALQKELDVCKMRLAECQRIVTENVQTAEAKELIASLQAELEEERKKSAGFINEVESLSTMYGELETENSRVQKLLVEKEQVLSKVMGERLRARQLLTTIKEEKRALNQGHHNALEKIKHLNSAVAASKKLAAEANLASVKAIEETRMLAGQLEKRRRIADEATVSARTANAEREEMKVERDSFVALVESSAVGAQEDKFAAQRLTEENARLKKRLEEQEVSTKANGKNAPNGESVRDEIIRELRKKLNCSVETSCKKEVVLTRCGHLFSKKCTDDLIATRNRKCPLCGKPFGVDDVQMIFF